MHVRIYISTYIYVYIRLHERYISAAYGRARVCARNDVTRQYLCYAWIVLDCGRAHASLNIIPRPAGTT